MTKLLAVLTACLALGLPLAACGSNNDDGGGGGSSASTTDQSTGGGGSNGSGGTATVDIPDIAFEPKNITVKAGTTVKWTNSDDLPHTVTKESGPGATFDSGTVNPGDEFEQTFDKPGKVAYHCVIHAGQDGTVTVK